jgi:DNA-binding GntR family transcriptional regulator
VFREIRAGSLVDEIEDQLRDAILDASLVPGVPIRESAVAQQMGVSRAPVREALRRLEQSGLVVKPRNRSYEVTSFTERDLYELASLRSALETLAAREAMRDDSEALERRLRQHLASIEKAAAGGRARTALSADRKFHESIVECSGNRRLAEAYSTLRDQIDLCLRTGHGTLPALDDIAGNHRVLVEHVAARDLDGLLDELDRHIRSGAGLVGEPDVAELP